MHRGLLALIAFCSIVAAVTADDHRVRGVVTDESGGVLPGVTVAVTSADGRLLGTVVTDGAGAYAVGPLSAERVEITFTLDGFSPATISASIADGDAIANPRLLLAPRSETVVVVGKTPVVRPVAPPPPRPPLRPRPVMWSVPDHDPESVCGPAKLESTPESLGTIRARRYAANGLYGAGDELSIDGGTASGLEIGQNFVVRRTFQSAWDAAGVVGEHTAGLVQIVAVDDLTALAVVIYACDEMLPGDRLAAFHAEARRPVQPAGKADYRRAARILFADIGQTVGAPRRMMVIDRGNVSGVFAGQRVTLFRRHGDGREPFIVGDGVVVAARRESATIRIDHAVDAILVSDLVAVQR